jgi:cold shock protein
MATLNGTIKRLNSRGFGFIAAGDGNEYFFHSSACSQTQFEELREGQTVSFDLGQGPKGPRGENVRLAE